MWRRGHPRRHDTPMTWHAARFFLWQAGALALAAVLIVVAWVAVHRRHHVFRRVISTAWVRVVLGIVVIIAALFWFATILRGVLTDGHVAAADRRLHNTLRLFNSEALHIFYSSISNIAGTMFIVPVAIALAALFWTHRRHYEAKLFVVAILGAEALSVILKYVVKRPRPPDAARLTAGPSFPSGHTLAATAIYGILTYLLLCEKPRRWWHIAVAVLLIPTIFLVAIARVYLGLHWPHDVIASLDIGCAWLACLTMLVRFRPDGTKRDDSPVPLRAPVFAAVAGGIVIYAILLGRFAMQREARPVLPPPIPAPKIMLTSFPSNLHRTSEDLAGGPMEPLAFLFVGSADDVRSTFERAGWLLADTPSVRGITKELFDVILNRPDPHGPATTAYCAEQPQDLTFERPGAASGSIRQRHHIRIWREPICAGAACTLIWGATCSYDMGVELVPKPYLVTHRIDPQVDHEREFVAKTLRSAGATDVAFVVVTGPRRGRNADGDGFSTDGRAHVMTMPSTIHEPPHVHVQHQADAHQEHHRRRAAV